MKPPLRAIAFLTGAVALCSVASLEFLAERRDEPLYPPPQQKIATRKLSDYFPAIRNSRADGAVYCFEGDAPGGTVVLLGGTHPNEVAGVMAANLLVENLKVARGRFIIIPRANHSAFTNTEPGEGHPTSFEIATPDGPRRFRVGCRFTNPLDQWPDPEVYLHYPSGQELSGNETRNLNRAFPGRPDGNFTERAAYAITALVKQEKADLVIDLHEASPEYPVINAIVAHEKAMDLAAMANLNLGAEGLTFNLEPSPQNFHGLTHRELGDATPALAVLMESANIMQGRLRGRTTAEKFVTGKDECYLAASKAGLLRVPYDSAGVSLDVRVGRHVAGVQALLAGLAFVKPEAAIETSGIPTYAEIQQRGLGAYLAPKSLNSNRSE
jgi:hypothetical protein